MGRGVKDRFTKGRTPLTASILNSRLADQIFKVLVGGKGIAVKRFGQKVVIESTGEAVGGTGSNGVWV